MGYIFKCMFFLFVLQVGEFDEASLREAVMKAAEDSAAPPSDDS